MGKAQGDQKQQGATKGIHNRHNETSGKGKLSLIVETTHTNHPKYLEILEHIKEKLEKDHLTKVEAIELRQQCYQTW